MLSDYDCEAQTSASPKEEEEQQRTFTSLSKKIWLLFVSIILIFSAAIETISFKSTATAFPFSACFIISLFCLCHSLLWFIICLYKIYILNKHTESILTHFPMRSVIIMGLLRSLSISVLFVTISRDIPGSLLIILLQFPTPITILLSRFISYIPFHSISRAHITAIVLIFIGIVFGFISSFFGHLGTNFIDYNNDNTYINAWWYIPIAVVSFIPQSMSVIYKEMNIYQCNDTFDKYCINAWIALFQCLFTFLLSPILIYLQDPNIHFIRDWYAFVHKGFLCLFSADMDGSVYCPNGNSDTICTFVTWLISSICVILLTHYCIAQIVDTPFHVRFCHLCGLLCAFIGFQTGIPRILIHGTGDPFCEWLLLGILCTFVGSMMLFIDFNPRKESVFAEESIQFDELKNSKKEIKSQLCLLKEQYRSLSVSQIQVQQSAKCVENITEYGNDDMSVNSESVNDYVFYLLMEQQKEIIKEEFNRVRSQSFSTTQQYSERKSKKRKSKRKRKGKKGKKCKKYYINEEEIQEYYALLQQEHLRRMNDGNDDKDDFEQ